MEACGVGQAALGGAALWFGGVPSIGIDFEADGKQLGQQYQFGILLSGLLGPVLGAGEVFGYAAVGANHLDGCEA